MPRREFQRKLRERYVSTGTKMEFPARNGQMLPAPGTFGAHGEDRTCKMVVPGVNFSDAFE